MPTRRELDDYLARAADITRPDLDARLNHLHRATTRRPPPQRLFVLAFDHRRQLEELAISTSPVTAQIAAFKSLVCKAAEQVAGSCPAGAELGIIIDERYGENILARMTEKQWWIGRPVEIPGSRPLAFDPRNGIGLPLQAWPAAHVVKCLVFYHPADELELRLQQEERLRQLHADCVALNRELMLEVIATASGQSCDDSTVANVMRRFYNLAIFPAWWKLESQSAASWEAISNVIDRYDPLCNGVLLLGLDAPEAQLRESFRVAARFPVCKGFAVGRSIFGEAARQWFAGQADDRTVIDLVAASYRSMIALWEEAAEGAASTPVRTVAEAARA